MNSMARIVIFLSVVISGFATSSCSYYAGSRPTLDSKFDKAVDPKGSFVYGYIDISDAKADMDWAILHRVEIGKEEVIVPMHTLKEGAFYLENVPPGSYSLHEFGGRAFHFFDPAIFTWRPYFYDIDGNIADYKIRITKPGIYYLGTRKFYSTGRNAFDLKTINAPTQKETLAKILELAKGTPWEARLRAHLTAQK